MGVCRSCGEANPPRAVFCMVCGARLGVEARPDARKPATILFNDVTGSTALGERHEPEAVRRIMSSYFTAVWRVCETHGGTVEKFIGDAVMAVFGIPIAQEDHALRAVRAAAGIGETIERLNDELERDWGVRIATRTGVNSGEVVAGDPAGGQFLVTGDAVNVAARLEQAARPGEVLLGEATRRLVGDAVEAEPIESLDVRNRQEPVRAWRLSEVRSAAGQPARSFDTPMIGRDPELARLRDAFARVVEARTAHRVTVFGHAGIGKSRLAHELAVALAGRALVLTGSCRPYGEGVTFSPLAEIVRQATGTQSRQAIATLLGDDPHAEVVAEHVAAAIGIDEAADTGRELSWAVRRLIEALAREQPLVLAFEDVHWAEPAMLDLLEYLGAHVSGASVLVLCMAREELLEQRPDWGRDSHEASAVALRPLSAADTQALAEQRLAGDELEQQVLAQLVARAEGNPLFVEQMLAFVREQGADPGAAMPPTIQALLAARLDRLPLEELAVIGAAAVVGRGFWRAAVAALLPAGEASRADSAIPALVRKQLVEPGSATLTGEDGFSFCHALIRDAAYERLTKESRAELHERFADWLEQRYAERMLELEAVVGHHFEQAHRCRVELAPADERARSLARRAAVRLTGAGSRAARLREDATAVHLLTRASRLLPAEAPERLELLPLIGESLEGTANHAKAGDVYAEALEQAIANGDAAVEARARVGRAHVWFIADPEVSTKRIVEEAERAIPVLESAHDLRHLAQAWRLVGEARMYEGKAASGQRALERALGNLRLEESPRSWNAISFATGMCLLDGPRPLDLAVAFAEEQLTLARSKGMRSFEADMLHVLGIGEGRRGHFEAGRQALASSTAISEELGLAYMAQWSKRSAGQLELTAGDPAAAERALRASYEVLLEMGLNSSLGETVAPLADALCEQGRHREAVELLDTISDDWAAGDASVEAPRLNVRAKLFAAQGWDVHAERASRRALRLVRATDWACLQVDTLLAHAAVIELASRDADAAELVGEALRIGRDKGYAAAADRAAARLEKPGGDRAERVR